MTKGVMGKQISYMVLIGVHLTMHLMHPNIRHVTTLYVCMHKYMYESFPFNLVS